METGERYQLGDWRSEPPRFYEDERKRITGIVIIEVCYAHYDRVIEELRHVLGSNFYEDALVYRGILVHPTRDANPSPVLLYLELREGQWGGVVNWCRCSLRFGHITAFRSARTGPISIVEVAQKGAR